MKRGALHPDLLEPGDWVGPWRIVEAVGLGGFARVFKVEREGGVYALKMALRPLSEQSPSEGNAVAHRMANELAALYSHASHPNLLRVYAVDVWPAPSSGYPYFVTDHVEGDTWHEWRWRTCPEVAKLVDVFTEVVRTVGVLHACGVYHRDLKAENLLVRRTDDRAFVIDFSHVRLPGEVALTLGVPSLALHLLPPELIAYTRSEAWKRGERFEGGVAADLYALGILLYQGLTDCHPFDPKLPDEALVMAIATVRPEAPRVLNPQVPASLSDITMRLLEKRPEERYPDIEALLQALWQATARERRSRAWQVRLNPREASVDVPRVGKVVPLHPPAPAAPLSEAPSSLEAAPPSQEVQVEVPRPRHAKRRLSVAVSVGVLGLLALGTFLWWAPLAATSARKGSPSMPTSSSSPGTELRQPSRSTRVIAWLCAATSLGCPAVQVKPPASGTLCPHEVIRSMDREFGVRPVTRLHVIVDVNQPGGRGDRGVYREGPLVSRVTYSGSTQLPEGTLLYGYLWTGLDIYADGEPAVFARYTEALLPDGRKVPVCMALNEGGTMRAPKLPGSTPEVVRLPRELEATGVRSWP
jgi:serine/threonine-protein kinase